MQLSELSFMSPQRISENLRFARLVANAPESTSTIEVLGSLQGFPIDAFSTEDRHQLVLGSHRPTLDGVIAGMMGGEIPASIRLIEDDLFRFQKAAAISAEAKWKDRFPIDYKLFDELIRWVIYVYRDEYSGGSVSNCIGWIWFNPEGSWSEADYLENLVHEYTHNVLFLEEMVHTLFAFPADIMAEPDNRVVSAIRRVPRFFDQAYHAAAVALVLAELYNHFKEKSKASNFIVGLLPSLDALKEKRHLMTENGYRILLEMIERAIILYEDTSLNYVD